MNAYENNQLTQYKNYVFEIFSLKNGVTIRADSDSVEVTTYQHALRNIACGLCGDLNDELTGDVKSAQECVMSSPGLAAYSYMLQDGRCAAIPDSQRETYAKESAQCLQASVSPSQVSDIFLDGRKNTKPTDVSTKRHIHQIEGSKVCISKRQVLVCSSDSVVAELVQEEMAFFCVARDAMGRGLERRSRRGDKIKGGEGLPTAYIGVVYVPKKC